jgi:hypothetical protein
VAYNHHGNLYALDGQNWTSVLPVSTAGDVLVCANDVSAGLETGMHQSSVE